MSQYFWRGFQTKSDPWINLDGRLNATPGGVRFPNKLDVSSVTNGWGFNLVSRPPWKVAGIDYAVGINRNLYPTNANLKDPAGGGLPSGASFAGTTVTVASPNPVVLDGWDFGLHNGLQIFLKGTANGGGGSLTVSNSNFKIGSNALDFIVADSANNDVGDLILLYNEMDGSGTGGSGTTFIVSDYHSITTHYNYWHDAFEDGCTPGVNAGAHMTLVDFRWNLFDTNGFGVGTHPDWLQINNAQDGTLAGRGFADNVIFVFNTCFETTRATTGGNSMVRLNTQVNASEVGNNTMLHQSGVAMTTWIDIVEAVGTFPTGDDPCTIINSNCHDNYSIATGFTVGWFNGFYTTFPTLANGIVNPTETGNIDMLTGATRPII